MLSVQAKVVSDKGYVGIPVGPWSVQGRIPRFVGHRKLVERAPAIKRLRHNYIDERGRRLWPELVEGTPDEAIEIGDELGMEVLKTAGRRPRIQQWLSRGALR